MATIANETIDGGKKIITEVDVVAMARVARGQIEGTHQDASSKRDE
jgi:hypothetical protein